MAGQGKGMGIGPNGEEEVSQPKLLRFQGRPKEMTPKAAMIQMMGYIYPSAFGYVLYLPLLAPIFAVKGLN